MGRLYRPESVAPEPELDEDGNEVAEVDPVQYGRIYIKEPAEPEPEPEKPTSKRRATK